MKSLIQKSPFVLFFVTLLLAFCFWISDLQRDAICLLIVSFLPLSLGIFDWHIRSIEKDDMELTLTSKAQKDRDDFYNTYPFDGYCTCVSKKKCKYCSHPGNPKNQVNKKFWIDEKIRRQMTGE